MNYDEIDVDKMVNEMSTAVAQENYRKATKKESYGSPPCRTCPPGEKYAG